MSRLLRAYLRVLDKHPWKTQALSTGVLMGTGDVIAQVAIERCPLDKYDPVRSSRYFLFGTFAFGPLLRSWYLVLERVWGPSSNFKKVIGKVSMDQLLFAPAVIPFIVGTLTYWECKSVDVVKDKLQKEYLNILVSNYKLWPAAQLVNFYFVPFQHRVMFVQIVALFWNTYLAWKISSESPSENKAEAKIS